MYKLALGLEYDGTGFHGWQRQPSHLSLATVQQAVEHAISIVANQEISITVAGRTDAGVHALGQVVHFNTTATRTMHTWSVAINRYLPAQIRVLWAEHVSNEFNARYSAISRAYRYIIYNSKIRPALLAHRVSWYYRDLNISTMQQAATAWLGEQDFSSFRAASCQSKSAVRNISEFYIYRNNNFVVCEIAANAFLYHMIRNMIGTLLPIGYGIKPVIWATEVLEAKNRAAAGATALPHGLYLRKVSYPKCYNLPDIKEENFI